MTYNVFGGTLKLVQTLPTTFHLFDCVRDCTAPVRISGYAQGRVLRWFRAFKPLELILYNTENVVRHFIQSHLQHLFHNSMKFECNEFIQISHVLCRPRPTFSLWGWKWVKLLWFWQKMAVSATRSSIACGFPVAKRLGHRVNPPFRNCGSVPYACGLRTEERAAITLHWACARSLRRRRPSWVDRKS